jgi:PleD family two-component response regulator
MNKDTDTRAHILIVDDDPSAVMLLANLLDQAGSIHVTTRGSEALKLAAAIRPDVVLLDIEMPDADGLEVCRQIKAHADLTDTLVLFVTSHDDAALEARALTAGAIDVVHKPVNPDIVRARVKNYLALKQRGDQLRRLSTVDGLTGARQICWRVTAGRSLRCCCQTAPGQMSVRSARTCCAA